MLARASAAACGKVILLGEHAVVHGHPALVTGIRARVQIEVAPRPSGERRIASALGQVDARVERALVEAFAVVGVPADTGVEVAIGGDLPIGMGLGSSAALSVALLRALASASGRSLADDEVARGAHRLEAVFHGTPSGVDSTAATYGGLLWFEAGPPPRHQPVRVAVPLELVVALSGRRHDTRQTVGGLRERAARAPAAYRPMLACVGELVAAARRAIEEGDLGLLGELMTMNHGLLRTLGVSTPELDAAVATALEDGALGAKLTGGGGGGAIVALAPGDASALASALGRRGYDVLMAPVEASGESAG